MSSQKLQIFGGHSQIRMQGIVRIKAQYQDVAASCRDSSRIYIHATQCAACKICGMHHLPNMLNMWLSLGSCRSHTGVRSKGGPRHTQGVRTLQQLPKPNDLQHSSTKIMRHLAHGVPPVDPPHHRLTSPARQSQTHTNVRRCKHFQCYSQHQSTAQSGSPGQRALACRQSSATHHCRALLAAGCQDLLCLTGWTLGPPAAK